MKTMKTLLLVLIVGMIFSACSSNKAQTKKYFRLTPPGVLADGVTQNLTLVVRRPKALSILGGRPIVATHADGSLIQLSHNFWLESPKVLLQDLLKSWATNHYQVVSYQVPSEGEHRILESRILAFEKKQSKATVAIEFTLYDEDNSMLFNQQFEAAEPINDDGYQAFAKAMSKAIAVIFSQLETELIRTK